MTFIPESIRVATETFSPVSAGMLALLAAIVITGFWEFLIQEIKLKRLEQKCRQMTATNQNIESDRDRGRDNGVDVGGGRECATDAKSVQASLDHFARAVERLQKLDSNLMGDNPNIDRVTHDLESDPRGVCPPATWQRATNRATKICWYCFTATIPKESSGGRSVSVAIVSPLFMTEKR